MDCQAHTYISGWTISLKKQNLFNENVKNHARTGLLKLPLIIQFFIQYSVLDVISALRQVAAEGRCCFKRRSCVATEAV